MVTMALRPQLRPFLENEDTFGTTLLAICLDSYGTECLNWDPETLWSELEDDFGVKLQRVNRDKIQALITVYVTNLFYVSVEAFSYISNALSGSEVDFRVWDMVTPEEAIWAIYEVGLHQAIDLDDGEEPPQFGHEVRRYLGVILRREGISNPPDILRIAETEGGLVEAEQWADDPLMFNAIHDKQRRDESELLAFLAGRLIELLDELERLPFVTTTSEAWTKFVSAARETAAELVQKAESLVA